MRLEYVEAICDAIQANINKMLNGYVNMCISAIDKNINEKNDILNSINHAILLQNRKIQKYQSESDFFKQQIKNLNNQRKEIKLKRKQDKKTLAMYLRYADRAYIEQREKVIRKINESRITDDKIMLILFLGLLDKDYQKVTGGVHENSHQYAVAKRSQGVAQ